jgi:hypothetical protein
LAKIALAMKDQFQRLLHLAKTTGDRLIITDPEGENAFVIMDIDQYEALIYADDICDDGEWDFDDLESADFHEDKSAKIQEEPTIWETMHTEGQGGKETWDLDGLSEEEMVDLEKQFQDFVTANGVKLEKKQEEIVDVIDENIETQSEVSIGEDLGEEQFYLEPIE